MTRVLRKAARSACTAGVLLWIGTSGAGAAKTRVSADSTAPRPPADAAATMTVEGVVQDARGAPVPAAEVEAEDAAVRSVTGEDGRFTIVLPVGVRALRARASGFASLGRVGR